MNENCIENIPYASSIAFILLLFGCGVFSGTIWEGTDRIEKLFNDKFFKLNEAEYIRVFTVTYAIITLLIGVILLIYGSVTSGNTRMKVYQTNRCHNLGKCFAGILLAGCYILLIGWLVVTCGGMVTVTIWLMVSTICSRESAYWASVKLNKDSSKFTYSFNLSNYGLYRPGNNMISSAGGFQEFCSEMSSIGPLFTVGFICSIIVVLSLLTYISALASNLVRLKYHPELMKFRQAAHSSLPDLSDPMRANNSLATHSSYPDPQTSNMYASQSAEMQPLTGSINYSSPYPMYGDSARAMQLAQYQKFDRQPNNSLV